MAERWIGEEGEGGRGGEDRLRRETFIMSHKTKGVLGNNRDMKTRLTRVSASHGRNIHVNELME